MRAARLRRHLSLPQDHPDGLEDGVRKRADQDHRLRDHEEWRERIPAEGNILDGPLATMRDTISEPDVRLLEFNADRVVAVLIDVLDRVRTLGFHPAHAHAGLGLGVPLGLKP